MSTRAYATSITWHDMYRVTMDIHHTKRTNGKNTARQVARDTFLGAVKTDILDVVPISDTVTRYTVQTYRICI